jgi:thiamine-monophosphate kinase
MEDSPIKRIGKFGLIDIIAGQSQPSLKNTVSGMGDDATVIDSGEKYSLVSTDLLLEGIHFSLVYFPLKHLGYKAVIRGISDIYAMNGTPEQILIGLGISSRFSAAMVEEIYSGIRLACSKYKVDLAGGDLSSSLTGLTISVTAVGHVEKSKLVRRSGAQPNDFICATGDFGAAYMGLQLLERERRIFEQDKSISPDLGNNDYVIGRQLKPELPVPVLNKIETSGLVPSSMIDATDGLASDLMHICKASGCGCRIFSKQIPVDYETARVSEEFNIDPLTAALNGGDDFEFIFTIAADSFQKIKDIEGVKAIGHITEKGSGNYLVGADGSEVELAAQGWGTEK